MIPKSTLRQGANGQRAFSLIELLIVLVIIGIITSIGIGSIMRAMQRTRVVSAAEALIRVHNEARRRAIVGKPELVDAAKMFGVALVPPADGQSGYAVLLQGTTGTDALMVDVDGDHLPDREVLKVPFGKGIEVLTSQADDGSAPSALGTRLVWWYGWGNGDPQLDAATTYPIAIGTPAQEAKARTMVATTYSHWWLTGNDATKDQHLETLSIARPAVARSPICSYLAFRQGANQVTVELYPLGPAHWEEAIP